MSTESIFINELKFDVKKDNIKQFIFRNKNKIIFVILVIFITSICYISLNIYKTNKIEKYNKQLFKIMTSTEVEKELRDFYHNKSTPRLTKTFAGFNLINLLDVGDEEVKKIYVDIFENEKELFFKYYAGLNLLILKMNNNEDSKEIENFINELSVKQNPLINLVLEEKALFLKIQGKNEEAKTLLRSLLNENLDEEFRERINQHLLYIN